MRSIRFMSAVAFTVVVASASTLTSGATSAPTAKAWGSVDAAYLTGPAGSTVNIANSKGVEVAHGTIDAQNALVIYNLAPGSGYHAVVTLNGQTSTTPAFSVLGTTAPAASLYKGVTLKPGLNYLPMRDGITLAGALRLPAGKTINQGPFPTLIEFSGYATAAPHSLLDAELGLNGENTNDPLVPSTATAVGALIGPANGFAVLSLQMRGTACSGGAFDLFGPTLATDGYDAIQELAQQSFVLNHKVALVGISYSGISQFAVAGLNPPGLAAMAPMSPTDDLYSTGAPGGIRNSGFAAGWINDRVHDAQAAPNGQAWANAEIAAGDTTCAANQQFHAQAQDVQSILNADPSRNPALYDVRSPALWATHITVPVYLTGALNDEQTGPQWPALITALAKDKSVFATMQNGTHVDSFSPTILGRWLEFLDLYVAKRVPTTPGALGQIIMSGVQPTSGGPAVTVRFTTDKTYAAALADFVKNTPRVRVLFDNGNSSAGAGVLNPAYEMALTSWPPNDPKLAQPMAYNLGPSGALTQGPAPSGSASFQPDPSLRPATSAGSNFNAWAAQPTYNWTPVTGSSGLGFLSTALVQPMTIVGPVALDLRLASTATDTDLQVTLSDVRPDGTEMYLSTGWLRASDRKLNTTASTSLHPVPLFTATAVQPLTPGTFVNLAVALNPVAYTLRVGDKLRVTIAAPGGDRPSWAFDTYQTHGTVTDTVQFGPSGVSTLWVDAINSKDAPTPTDQRPACGTNRGMPCRTYVALNNGG